MDIDIDSGPDVTCKSFAHIKDRTMLCMFGVPCFRESWLFSMPKSGLRNFAIRNNDFVKLLAQKICTLICLQ